MNGIGLPWFNRGKRADSGEIDPNNIPAHVAIIMDGNGRWASKRGLPRAAGHRSGMAAIKEVAIAAGELGVKVLTLYAFSTENWKRPRDEVDFLMKLPQEFLARELEELNKNNVQIRMMGWKEDLPEHTLRAVEEGIKATSGNTGLILNFALNYGSRREMLAGIRQIAELVRDGKLCPEDIDEALFSNMLHTRSLPDPDLLIRTSGEQRISNFLLWQLAYTELAFVDVYWPEFTREHFRAVIGMYQKRNRRYGAI